jgi:hypothetical protein
MKIRLGFVSNSSTMNFLIGYPSPNKPSITEIEEWIKKTFKMHHENDNWLNIAIGNSNNEQFWSIHDLASILHKNLQTWEEYINEYNEFEREDIRVEFENLLKEDLEFVKSDGRYVYVYDWETDLYGYDVPLSFNTRYYESFGKKKCRITITKLSDH